MNSKSEEYRRNAEKTERLAAEATDEHLRHTYLEMAQKWHKLADQAERNGW